MESKRLRKGDGRGCDKEEIGKGKRQLGEVEGDGRRKWREMEERRRRNIEGERHEVEGDGRKDT